MIDVIVIDYKAKPFIDRLVVDLKRFTVEPHRIWVWDNVRNQKNLSMLRNEMASKGDGEYIFFINPDIVISPKWDVPLRKALSEPSACAAVPSTVTGKLPADGSELKYTGEPVFPRVSITEKEFTPFCALLVRRSAWRELGGYDERFRFSGADRELCQRILLSGKKVFRCLDSIVYHADGHSRRMAKNAFNGQIEQQHKEITLKKILSGKVPRWNNLSKSERQAIRRSPAYTHIGGPLAP